MYKIESYVTDEEKVDGKSIKSSMSKLLSEVGALQLTRMTVIYTGDTDYALQYADGSVAYISLSANKYEVTNKERKSYSISVSYTINLYIVGVGQSRIDGMSKGYSDLKCMLVLIGMLVDLKTTPTLSLIGRHFKKGISYYGVAVLDISKYIDLSVMSIKYANRYGLIKLVNSSFTEFNRTFKLKEKPAIRWDTLYFS